MNKICSAVRSLIFAGLAVVLFSPAAQADDRWFYHHHDRPYYWREARRPSLAFGPRGYVIVPAPAPTVAPQTITVNVPNKNGSYTPVKLQIASNGTSIGPQGEVYLNQPTMEQLKQMYGK